MVDNLYLSALRTQSLPFRVQEFVDFKVREIAEKTIVRAIRDEATSKNMPQRYVNNIHSEFDGKELWIWVDFKGKKQEPLDFYFEEGTKRHFIKPVFKKALRWFEGSIKFFSKGHYVSGIQARHVFREGLKKGYPEFKRSLQREIEIYLKETTLFG